MKSKLIAINIPCKALCASKDFFSQLVGIDSSRALSTSIEAYHVGIADGVYLWLSAPFHENDVAPTLYFSVDDLAVATSEAAEAGCESVMDTMNVPLDLGTLGIYEESLRDMGVTEGMSDQWGRVQLMRDPSNTTFALCEIEPHSQIFFGVGNYANPSLGARLRADANRSLKLAAQLN